MLALLFIIASSGVDVAPAWTLDVFKALRKEGLLVGYPDGLHSRPIPIRYEGAVATRATISHTRTILDSLAKPEAYGNADAYFRDVHSMRHWAPLLFSLEKLYLVFYPEISKMDAEIPLEQIRQLPIDALAVQFRLLAYPFAGRP
jgi:hypothetical protein